jgi:xylulokinase
VDKINIVGGGAQSGVWCQIFADVMDLEIRQVQDPVCANARGAAWIGAVGLGEIQFKDVEALTHYKNVYTPQARNRQIYDDRFAIFKDIYKSMSGIYKRLNS